MRVHEHTPCDRGSSPADVVAGRLARLVAAGHHIVHFILEAVEPLSLQGFRVNVRGTGRANNIRRG